jgi:alpha-L-arabinofuranosidase
VTNTPDGLDVVASRTGNKLFLHVVNTNRDRSVTAKLDLPGAKFGKATAFEIADDPMIEVSDLNSGEVMQINERQLAADGTWDFPAASVTAVEVDIAG